MSKRGFTLVELLMVIVVIAVGLMAVLEGISYSMGLLGKTKSEITAINLAREGMEAVYNIRDTNRLRRSGEKDKNRLRTNPIDSQSLWMGEGVYTVTQSNGVWRLTTDESATTEQPLDNGLVAHYTFDDPNNLGRDDIGNHHGTSTANGSPDGVLKSGLILRKYGERVVVNGSDDGLGFTSSFSYGGWFNAKTLSRWAGIVSRMRTWRDGYNLQVGTEHNIACGWRTYTESNMVPRVDVRYHAMCVYDGSKMRLYVNGVLQDDVDSNVMLLGADNFSIGQFYTRGTLYFDGKIDDVRVYNRALSAEDVQGLYAMKDNAGAGLIGDPLCYKNGKYISDTSCDENTASGYHRTIIGKGIYNKNTGEKMQCSGNASSDTDSMGCYDDTPKEFRFCSRVVSTRGVGSDVEFCGVLTNFEK